MNLYLLLIPIIVIYLLYMLISKGIEQSNNDWKTLEYLKNKANEVNTKDEIEEFHKEFCEKASKINNEFISPKLNQIDGYLRGLYKQFNK